MAFKKAIGGILEFSADGIAYRVVGDWTYSLGIPARPALIGATGTDGHKVEHQVAMIKGQIRDVPNLSVKTLQKLDDIPVVLTLEDGKKIVYNDAWFSGTGETTTDERTIEAEFSSESEAEEILNE